MTKSNKNTKLPSLRNPEIFFVTLGGLGLSPKAPGTVASFVTIALFYSSSFLKAPFILFVPPLIILLGASVFLIDYTQKKHQLADPSWIVIDEFLGMAVAWFFIAQHHWVDYLAIFILFRVFDIFKPWPIGLVDKKLKNGFGVILDDLIAGLFAGLCYLVVVQLMTLLDLR